MRSVSGKIMMLCGVAEARDALQPTTLFSRSKHFDSLVVFSGKK